METLCQNEITNELSKMSVKQDVNAKNGITTITLKKNEKELETPIIKSGKIYLITNLINNKKYVGITTQTLKDRWYSHCSFSKIQSKLLITRAIKKYGKNNFKMELIEELVNVTEEELLVKETYYIDKFNTLVDNNGYNLMRYQNRKLVLSESTRQKMSKAHSGERHHFYGIPRPKNVKLKISKSHKGMRPTEETRKKLSLKAKEKYGNFARYFDPTIRTFENIITNETFTGLMCVFRRKHNLTYYYVKSLICGRKQINRLGWVLVGA